MDQSKILGSLNGRTALVTAAGQGIGRATALLFADAGATVLATDLNPKWLAELSQERPDILTRQLDVTDSAVIVSLGDEMKSIEVLFNCAGYVHQGGILDCSEHDWKLSFDLNVTSCS